MCVCRADLDSDDMYALAIIILVKGDFGAITSSAILYNV